MNKIKFLLCFALLVSGVEGRGQIYINSYAFGAPAALFLDDYPTSEVALSFRKLREGYTGNLLTVRRVNGDTSLIGFSSNYLDTAAIKTFCGTTSGDTCWVRRWFDQSGNDRHVEQTTNANQPIILRGGAINYEKNYPAILFDGSNDRLINNNVATPFSGTDKMLFGCIVQKCTFNNAQGALYGFGLGANNLSLRWLGSSDLNSNIRLQERDNNLVIRTLSGGNITTYSVLVIRSNMDNAEVWANNTSTLSNTMAAGNTSLDRFSVGALNLANTHEAFYKGNIQELILYNADKASDRTGMQTNINTFYSIY